MASKSTILWIAGGAASVAIFGSLFTLISGGSPTVDQQLDAALSILERGRWDVAGRIARDLEAEVNPDENGSWHYVQGVSNLMSVQKTLATPRGRKQLQLATDHLIKARDLGFPAGCKGKGNYYLGWCFFNTFRWDEAAKQLQDIPRLWPEKRSDALRMTVESQLRKDTPDINGAQETLDKWLNIPGMSATENARIRLAEAQLAFHNQQNDRCEELLLQIDPALPEFFDALVWRGRWRLERAQEAIENSENLNDSGKLLEEAEKIFRQAKVTAETPSDLRRQASYLSGRGLRLQNRLSEALGTFSGVRQSDPQSAEAIAAGVEEAEILLETGDFDSALSTARGILRSIGDLGLYNELWITAPELKRRLLDLGRSLRDQGEFARAIQVAKDIALVFPMADSLRLKAETYELWGDRLRDELAGSSASDHVENRPNIIAKYAAAAENFDALARLVLRSDDYTDVLWRAITNYQAANDLAKANQLLKDYIRFEDRTKSPRGFLAMGRNEMNAGNWEAALVPLKRCLTDFPDHPVSFDARLMAAQAKSEMNQLDEAISLLKDNLYGFKLHPTNRVWRDSMFQLGNLTYRLADQRLLDLQLNPDTDLEARRARIVETQALMDNAMMSLGEAFRRWNLEEDPRHADMRYLYARAHRQAAELPKQLIDANPNIIESARRKLMQQRRQLLESALGEFQKLEEEIAANPNAIGDLSKSEAILRNCLFGQADSLFDLGLWEEAIDGYYRVTQRFMNQPESLEALLQVVQCYENLDRPDDAKKVLNTARQVLSRINPEYDNRFVSVTRASRDEWERLISTMQTWE